MSQLSPATHSTSVRVTVTDIHISVISAFRPHHDPLAPFTLSGCAVVSCRMSAVPSSHPSRHKYFSNQAVFEITGSGAGLLSKKHQ